MPRFARTAAAIRAARATYRSGRAVRSADLIVPETGYVPVPVLRPRPTTAGRVSVRRVADGGSGRGARSNVPPWLAKFGLMSWYLIGIIIVVSLAVFATTRIQLVFIAVFVALVFTSVLNPVADYFARAMPRPVAVVLALLASFLFFAGLLYYVISSVVGQWDSLARRFEDGIGTILDFLENGPLPWHVTQDEVYDWVNDLIRQSTEYIQSNAGDLAGQVVSNAGAVALVFTIFALSLFITIFLLLAGKRMWLWFLNQLPARNRVGVHRAASAGWYTFSGYARGTMIVATVDGILAFILLLVVGVPLAAPLAVLVFVGAFIPLIGAPLAMIVAAVVALATGGFLQALIVTIGVAMIGQIEGHILEPFVMGKQVSLHPVIVALGVTAGTFLAGLLGAIIAIPLLAVIWAVFTTLRTVDPPLREIPDVTPGQPRRPHETTRASLVAGGGTHLAPVARHHRKGSPEVP
ncbi:MAG: AI-2E family transporter [Actinobacteria bacterium]|nr:AI-2E family transporter [Actinomycetota bacterium]